MSNYIATFVRTQTRQLADETIKADINSLCIKSLKGNLSKAWKFQVSRTVQATKEGAENKYTLQVKFRKTSGHMAKADKQWEEIIKHLLILSNASKYNANPWKVTSNNSENVRKELVQAGRISNRAGKVKEVRDIAEIKLDRSNNFEHLFDRDDHIDIIYSALEAGKNSNWNNRFHCVLFGPPACGKSDLLISTGNMLGKENEAYLKLDATSTTEAGIQRLLLDSDMIPPVLIVEEIEKADEKSLRWLLGILDHRAEIRKTNFNIGNQAKNVKMLCLATVNDIALFRRLMSGALASRFAHEIYCPRPNRELLKKILEREVKKINGNPDWIEPTLKFCVDKHHWDDPRKIIPVCLCGRDKLLNNSYQLAIERTRLPKEFGGE